VDDEAGVAEVLKLALSRAGHQVETASGGEEAVRLLRAGASFDVVVTDLGMPGVSGSDVAAEAKKQLPDSKVLVVTGFGSDTEEKLNRLPFVDRVLKKPFSVPDLLKTVETLAEETPASKTQKTSTK
jgi:CheY-like chemotaxis protein